MSYKQSIRGKIERLEKRLPRPRLAIQVVKLPGGGEVVLWGGGVVKRLKNVSMDDV